jgi:hypothetical protein
MASNNIDLALASKRYLPNRIRLLQLTLKAKPPTKLIEASRNRNNLAINYLNKALQLNKKKTQNKIKDFTGLKQVYEKTLDKTNAYFYLKQHLNLKKAF